MAAKGEKVSDSDIWQDAVLDATELVYKDCASSAVMLKMLFKGTKEDGFWRLVYEELQKSSKCVVWNKCANKYSCPIS